MISTIAKNTLAAALIAGAALGATACGETVRMSTPSGFAEMHKQDHYAYRATTASGVVVAVRNEKNEPEGDLEFWSEAVDTSVTSRGYTRILEKQVESPKHRKGWRGVYEFGDGAAALRYAVTVYVTRDRVLVVEEAGPKAVVVKLDDALANAAKTVEID